MMVDNSDKPQPMKEDQKQKTSLLMFIELQTLSIFIHTQLTLLQII